MAILLQLPMLAQLNVKLIYLLEYTFEINDLYIQVARH